MGVFGARIVREDDALRAVRAAAELGAEKDARIRELEHALEASLTWGRHDPLAPPLQVDGDAPAQEEDPDVAPG